MDTLIEQMAKILTEMLYNNEHVLVKQILDNEYTVIDLYNNYISDIKSIDELMSNSMFKSVYEYGYDNIDWYKVWHELYYNFKDELVDSE